MGRYSQKVQRLLGLPGDGSGIPFGSFRPCDIQYLVEELAADRIADLKLIGDDPDLSAKTRALVSGRKFHTFTDYCATVKQRKPKPNDIIDFGASLQRGKEDLQGYLQHISEHDPGFHDFLYKPQPAAIPREAFDTSFYITGETKSGKSYLIETLGFLLARQPKASVWVIDPHGSLARSCAEWKENLGRNVFYFDVSLGGGSLPCFNPFDQIPPCAPSQRSDTLDLITQEQVNALSLIGDGGNLSGIMRNMLTYCVRLMLAHPNGSLHELTRLLDDGRNEDLVEAGCRLDNPFAREFFAVHFPKKNLAVTKAAISNRLTEYLSSSLLYRLTTGKSTFQIAEAFNTPGVYIFNLGKGVVGEATSVLLGRLILAQLQASAFKRERDKETEDRARTANIVFVDECQNFVNPTTGTIVAETRKYRLSLGLGQQFPGQDIEPGLMKNIATNTPLKFTGVGSEGTYRSVAMSQNVSMESFYGLKPRLFHVSKRGSMPFIASASPLLASRQERMTHEEWESFIAGQLSRWYGHRDTKGVRLVSGADPEEYTHERPPERATGAIPPPVAPSPPPSTVQSVLRAMRQKLTGEKPKAPPAPANHPAFPNSSGFPNNSPPQPAAPEPPPASEYGPETEISPGVFHSRKKPRFPRP